MLVLLGLVEIKSNERRLLSGRSLLGDLRGSCNFSVLRGCLHGGSSMASSTKGIGVGHCGGCGPLLHVVFGSNEILNLVVVRDVALGELGLPEHVAPGVSPLHHACELFLCPRIEINGFH